MIHACRFVLAGAALVAAAALIGCRSGGDTITVTTPEQTGITVNGTGRVVVTPDVGVISLGVELSRETVAEAREEAAQAMEAVRRALLDEGVAERDIQTQYFNIYPQYAYQENREPRIIGFTVSNTVQVKVRDLDSFSRVLDTAVDAGGDAMRVNGIAFSVDEPETYMGEARDLAMADARQRAEQLASAAGATLGAVRSISESGGGFPPPMPVAGAERGGAFDTGTPLSPGETEVALTVSVVYELN